VEIEENRKWRMRKRWKLGEENDMKGKERRFANKLRELSNGGKLRDIRCENRGRQVKFQKSRFSVSDKLTFLW
jgi:hypothetical protein